MNEQASSHAAAQNRTVVERRGDRELVVTRVFDAPPGTVFAAWSRPELFRQWWMPRSVTGVSLRSCDMDVRTGGKYSLEFGAGGQTMTFYGKYLEVVPDARIVWTNDEGEEEGAVTTVTFEDRGGKTLLTFHELYPSREALEEAMTGSAAGLPEQMDQLAELLSVKA
uniref:SRPBCC family protein n=1 Tax=Altererythrobacter segetis TaxID=1104773 RepID=UPI00140D716D|nr:SRPBCC family protein [Altererythrobacter segetis]